MLRKPSGLSIVVLSAAALVLGSSPAARADRVFHTTQYPLSSVADGSVHGWVTDIHTQGPTIYAQERYLGVDVGHPPVHRPVGHGRQRVLGGVEDLVGVRCWRPAENQGGGPQRND